MVEDVNLVCSTKRKVDTGDEVFSSPDVEMREPEVNQDNAQVGTFYSTYICDSGE